ncbi:MAG TPA: UbiA prenyltransferase family protein [Clostridiales bacterium]|nr:UbiA prenyltransferase family protein [Clostridiales bacterium]
MKKYFKLMRVKHYIKNVIIMLPLIFSGKFFDISLLWRTLVGVIAFSLVSSVIYIINDIRDAESDRKHPTKCKRPVASGEVSVKSARVFALVLFVASLIVNYYINRNAWAGWVFFALYFMLNIAYSLGLKNIPIVDVAILVSGFLLRLLFGSAITGIEISKWLYLTVISLSFYLGLGKRRNEGGKQADGNTRKVLKFYNYNFLDKNMYMCMALAIAFYSLWSVDNVTVYRVGSSNLIWTVPLLILVCMKYSSIVEGNSDGDPVEVVFQNKMLLGLVVLFGLTTMGIIYL